MNSRKFWGTLKWPYLHGSFILLFKRRVKNWRLSPEVKLSDILELFGLTNPFRQRESDVLNFWNDDEINSRRHFMVFGQKFVRTKFISKAICEVVQTCLAKCFYFIFGTAGDFSSTRRETRSSRGFPARKESYPKALFVLFTDKNLYRILRKTEEIDFYKNNTILSFFLVAKNGLIDCDEILNYELWKSDKKFRLGNLY